MGKRGRFGADDPVFHLPPHWRGDYTPPGAITARVPQWWTTQYGVEKWWERGYDGTGVVVVVVDTGRVNHPDLAGQIVGAVDGTGQGLDDQNGHSTMCSSCIAALRDGVGVVGFAPGAKVVTAKGLGASGSGSANSLATAYDRGCEEAKRHARASIITSNSYGGPGRIGVLETVMQRRLAEGIIPIAAAGNDGMSNGVDEPAARAFVLGIGAHDEQRRLASFSDRGAEVDLVAPGVQMLMAALGGGWQRGSGTSFACPSFAGMLAMRHSAEYKVLGAVKTKTVGQVNDLLDASCDDGGPAGRDPGYGRGFVNLDRFLTHGLDVTPPPPPPPGEKAYIIRVFGTTKPVVEEVAPAA